MTSISDTFCKKDSTETLTNKFYQRISYFDRSTNTTVVSSGKLVDQGLVCKNPVRSGKSAKVKFKDTIREYKMKVIQNKKVVSVEVKQNLHYPNDIGLVQFSDKFIKANMSLENSLEFQNEAATKQFVTKMKSLLARQPSHYSSEYQCNQACFKKCKLNLASGLLYTA